MLAVPVPIVGGVSRGVDLLPRDWREIERGANRLAEERGETFRITLVGLPGRPSETLVAENVTALQQMLQDKEPPDLVGLEWPGGRAHGLPPMKDLGLIQALDQPMRSSRSLTAEQFTPRVLDTVRIQGQLYAVPAVVTPTIMWVDQALLDARGRAFPDPSWGWQQLAEEAAALTVDEDGDGQTDQWGLYRQLPYEVLIWQAGGDVVSADRRRTQLREAPAIEALRFAADLHQKFRVVPPFTPGRSYRIGRGGLKAEGVGKAFLMGMAYALAPRRDLGNMESPAPAGAVAPPAVSTVRMTEVPRGRERATRVNVSATLSVTTKAADRAVAHEALALCLEAFEMRGAVSGRVGGGLQRATGTQGNQTSVPGAEDELAIISRSLSYGRTLPLDLPWETPGVLQNGIDQGLREGTLRPSELADQVASAIEKLLTPTPPKR